MNMFVKAGIVGTGLIGGSIGIALKKNGLAETVVGTGRNETNLRRAVDCGAIDSGSTSIDILAGCDLIILAAPVNVILSQIGDIKKITGADCLVIDVASTKAMVVAKAGAAFKHFIGCHPLAGSEKQGISNARGDMFAGAQCIITPVKNTDRNSLRIVKTLWKKLGAEIKLLDPRTHDKILAFMSHLPHIAAYALVETVPAEYLEYVTPSFRDITRVASSSPELWTDICLTNRSSLLRAIDLYAQKLGKIRAALNDGNTKQINIILQHAQKKRNGIL